MRWLRAIRYPLVTALALVGLLLWFRPPLQRAAVPLALVGLLVARSVYLLVLERRRGRTGSS